MEVTQSGNRVEVRGVTAICLELRKLQRKHLLPITLVFLAVELLWLWSGLARRVGADIDYRGVLFQLPSLNAIFLPMLSTIIMSTVCDIESPGNMYKELLTLQTPQGLFRAKWGVAVLALGALTAVHTALVLALLKTLGLDALPDAGTLILYWVSTYAVCLLMATLVQALCFGAHGQFVPLVFGVALSFLGLFSLYLPTALAHLVPSSYFGLLSTVGMNYDQGLGQMSFYMRAWSVPDFLIVVALSAVSYVLSCRAFVRKEL
ncbi:MAG: ABC transporter permease [Olsenella sp.]